MSGMRKLNRGRARSSQSVRPRVSSASAAVPTTIPTSNGVGFPSIQERSFTGQSGVASRRVSCRNTGKHPPQTLPQRRPNAVISLPGCRSNSPPTPPAPQPRTRRFRLRSRPSCARASAVPPRLREPHPRVTCTSWRRTLRPGSGTASGRDRAQGSGPGGKASFGGLRHTKTSEQVCDFGAAGAAVRPCAKRLADTFDAH